MSDLADRLVELEIKSSFQEQTLKTLDQVVIEQAQTIETLRQRLERLETRVRAMITGDEEGEPE